ncbi:hypothetical protein BaRGS_00014101 [Batillaria attramentaria]|uniref:RING-type domain-containing protein n=1 Tax=Batillaria attramentaria TaxID=370345 RepID=A0ABD0L640_9CAEN
MAEAHQATPVSEDSSGSDAELSSRESLEMSADMNGANGADDAGLQRFLQQQRRDLMFELRRISHGERPVTGQNNRENIASFMAKHLQEPSGADSGKENVPANVDAVEEHRPEAVVVEVQGVFEQRRVSSMLQTQSFRRHLENIIRGSIASARRPAPLRTRASEPPRPSTPVQRNAASAAAQSDRGSSFSSASGSSNEAAAADTDRVPSPQHPNQQVPAAPPLPTPAREPGVRDRGGEGQLWNSISQVQHEEMVYEISELLHRRLVSTTLGSEFRGLMEVHLQNHLQQTGTDGEAVAEFIRTIPQSDLHIPNDFSHLGIAPGPRDDNSDNMSITGISATAVPYTQTNLHLNREIQSLKAQMEEMKNMMRLSFDLQMDIQRAIRQEVAAALASVTAQGATAAAAQPEVRSTPVNDTHCLICLENHSDSVLYQCGHMCVCFTCGKNLITRGNGKCPVCRAPIKDIIRAYKTNIE